MVIKVLNVWSSRSMPTLKSVNKVEHQILRIYTSAMKCTPKTTVEIHGKAWYKIDCSLTILLNDKLLTVCTLAFITQYGCTTTYLLFSDK